MHVQQGHHYSVAGDAMKRFRAMLDSNIGSSYYEEKAALAKPMNLQIFSCFHTWKVLGLVKNAEVTVGTSIIQSEETKKNSAF